MRLLTGFLRDRRGNVAITFGVALLPMLLAVGTAVDYSRAASVRSSIQAAADAAVLAASRDGMRKTDAELAVIARQFFDANFTPGSDVTITTFNPVRAPNTVTLTVAGEVKTAVMGIAGVDAMPISTVTQSIWGSRIIEVALALDTTGSMLSNGKLTELKAAVKDLLSILNKASVETGDTRVAMVPFATQVRVAYDGKTVPSWVDFVTDAKMPAGQDTVEKKDWKGCITDRDMPYDTTDDAPHDVKKKKDDKALYIAVECQAANLSTLLPLSDDLTSGGALYKAVDKMVADGNTNVTIGVAHAAAMLSPDEPHAGAKAFGTDRLDKYMIVLTDGDNTENRFSTKQSEIDARTKLACTNAKDNSGNPAKNIRIYSIKLIDGNAALLRDCASEPSMFYEVKSAAELTPVFQAIGNEIAAIRLTN